MEMYQIEINRVFIMPLTPDNSYLSSRDNMDCTYTSAGIQETLDGLVARIPSKIEFLITGPCVHSIE